MNVSTEKQRERERERARELFKQEISGVNDDDHSSKKSEKVKLVTTRLNPPDRMSATSLFKCFQSNTCADDVVDVVLLMLLLILLLLLLLLLMTKQGCQSFF